MIIARSPLRISIGGGGTDLPSYYREHGGYVISAAIDKYVYISVHHTFEPKLILRYSQMEQVASTTEVKHPIFREALQLFNMHAPHLEISSLADIPAGTGLGSSGSFTVALLKALNAYHGNLITAKELAETACHIEIDKLQEPVGKQDQYIAVFGGLTAFEFCQNGQVNVSRLAVSRDTVYALEDHLLLFFTGYARSASDILADQDKRTRTHDHSMIDNLHFVKKLGLEIKQALESGDVQAFGQMLDAHWQHKRQRSSGMSRPEIDQWYQLAMANGALGGKLIGAGGGGFLMFYATDRAALRHAMTQAGLEEVRFRFDHEGTKVIAHDK